ncbi:MAG: hypothetical protein KGJ86_11190 [Chloroflexota bacterium]|nr:hypothetical protein [Chloroflexota bacterium]
MSAVLLARPSALTGLQQHAVAAGPITALVNTVMAIAMALHPPTDPDLGWHLRSGLQILSTHCVPTTDFISFTAAGHNWFANEWLWDAVIAQLAIIGGIAALVAVPALCMGLVSVFVFLTARGRQLPPLAACTAMAIAMINLKPTVDVRPALTGAVLTAAFIWTLERRRTSLCSGVALVALELLWTNLHGSFPIGIAILALYSFEFRDLSPFRLRPIPGRLLITLAAATVTLVNPRGPSLWGFVVSASRLPFNQLIEAWRPLDPRSGSVAFTTATLALIVTCIPFAVRNGRLRACTPQALILFVASTAAMIHSLEFLPVFAVAAAPVVPALLPASLNGGLHPTLPRWEAALVLIAGFGLASGAMMSLTPSRYAHAQAKTFPVHAAAAIKALGPSVGPMFNFFNWGGFLAGELPSVPIFVDSRTEMYPPQVLSDYVHAVRGDASVLDRYPVKLALIDSGSPLDQALAQAPSWKRLYYDDQATAYERQSQ